MTRARGRGRLASGSLLPAIGVIGALGVAAWVLPAQAQVYVGQRTDLVAPVSLTPLTGWSGFQVRGLRTRVGDYRLQETILGPGLHLATSGSLYHRQLAAFRLQGTGLLERRVLSGASERQDDLTLSDFDFVCGILQEKPANLRLFANRSNGWITSPYAASIQSRTTRWGAEARAGTGTLPVTASWSRDESRQRNLIGDRRIDQEHWRLTARRLGRTTRATVSLRREDHLQNLQFQDFQTDGATANATTTVAEGIFLGADARWLHRYGSRNQHQGSLGADLRAPLGGGVDAAGDYRRFRGRPGQPGTPTTAQDGGSFALRHLLYGSLQTDLRIHALRESADIRGIRTGSLREQGLDLNLAYHRRTPAGTLRLGCDRTHARREVESQDREIAVSNEEHRLADGREARLLHPWVTAGSVVVSDESGFLVYREGFDYDLIVTGPYTGLWRRPDGDIPEGGAVQVDYRHAMSPDATFTLDGTALDARFEAKGNWTVWAGRHTSDEDLVSGDPGRPLWGRRQSLAGADLALGRLTIRSEYEVEDVAASRLHSWRSQADLDLQPGARWRAAVGASHTRGWDEDPGWSQEFLQIHGRVRLDARGGPRLDLEAWTRLDRSEAAGAEVRHDLLGIRLQGSHRVREVALEMQALYQQTDRGGVRDHRLQAYAGVRRSF